MELIEIVPLEEFGVIDDSVVPPKNTNHRIQDLPIFDLLKENLSEYDKEKDL